MKFLDAIRENMGEFEDSYICTDECKYLKYPKSGGWKCKLFRCRLKTTEIFICCCNECLELREYIDRNV